MKTFIKYRKIISCLSIVFLMVVLCSGCAKEEIPLESQNEPITQSAPVTQEGTNTQDESTTKSNPDSQESSTMPILPESMDWIAAVKQKPVSDLLTSITIPDLTVTLGELFDPQDYFECEWLDLDGMVKLILMQEESSNKVIMTFNKIGNEIDFPQVSTLLVPDNRGTEYIPWSFQNLDDALVKKLLAEGYIKSNGGYQAVQ